MRRGEIRSPDGVPVHFVQTSAGRLKRGIISVLLSKRFDGRAPLSELPARFRLLRRRAGGRRRRYKDGEENADDGDHREQFDERKPAASFEPHALSRKSR